MKRQSRNVKKLRRRLKQAERRVFGEQVFADTEYKKLHLRRLRDALAMLNGPLPAAESLSPSTDRPCTEQATEHDCPEELPEESGPLQVEPFRVDPDNAIP